MTDWTAQLRQHTHEALAGVTCRLVQSLATSLGGQSASASNDGLQGLPEDLRAAMRFAASHAQSHLPHVTHVQQGSNGEAHRTELPQAHPLTRLRSLITDPWAAQLAIDLIALTCLPEWHEGLATLCRLTHPQGQSWPTVTLTLSWLESEYPDQRTLVRDAVEDILMRSPLARLGLIQLQGDGPWHSRTLVPSAGLWPALMARSPDQAGAPLVAGFEQVPGLDTWLQQADVQQAVLALRRGLPCQVLLVGGDAAMRQTRVRALLGAAQVTAVRHRLNEVQPNGLNADAAWTPALALSWLYQSCLWIEERNDPLAAEQANAPDPMEAAWPHAIKVPVIGSAAQERRLPVLVSCH